MHAGLEKLLVVGGLSMVDHELVGPFADQQINANAPVAGGSDGFQHGIIGNEVGGAEHQALAGVVDEGVEHPQVWFGVVAGARRDELEDVLVVVGGVIIKRGADG